MGNAAHTRMCRVNTKAATGVQVNMGKDKNEFHSILLANSTVPRRGIVIKRGAPGMVIGGNHCL